MADSATQFRGGRLVRGEVSSLTLPLRALSSLSYI